MGGGEFQHGFPHPNPTIAYWQDPPHAIANHRTTPDLPTSKTFDYVIIGSGVSGAAIAFKLQSRDPAVSVLMIEARTAASGASGRNGGHCRAGWWQNFKRYAQAFGVDDALKFEKLEELTVQDIKDFVREHDIDCDFQNVETADIYMTQAGWDKVMDLVDFREEVRARTPGDDGPMTKRTIRLGKEAEEHLNIPGVLGVVTYPAHTQNPYLLVCSMLELAIKKGLNLQTNTTALAVRPVTSDHGVSYSSSPSSSIINGTSPPARWAVDTDRGTVRAVNVVFATNGYTNAIHPGLASTGFLTPARSQVTAVRPGSNIAGHNQPRYSGGIVDSPTGDYFMTRPRGTHHSGADDVLWGGARSLSHHSEVGITDDSVFNEKIANYLRHAPAQVYGPERWGEEGEVLRDWTGITCYTPDTLPLVGQVPATAAAADGEHGQAQGGGDGLWMSVGMNGHGMAMAFRCAEALVEMMTTGKEPDWFPKAMRLERAWEAKEKRIRLSAWAE